MKIISFINNKGGVGKTACSVQFSHYCNLKKKKTLLVDIEFPGHSTSAFLDKADVDTKNSSLTLFDDEFKGEPYKLDDHLDILVTNSRLNDIDKYDFKVIINFKNNIEKIAKNYDVIIIDPPPGLNLRLNSVLASSNYIITPVKPSQFSLNGFIELTKTINYIKQGINPSLPLPVFLFNLVNSRSKRTAGYIQDINTHLHGYKIIQDHLIFSDEVEAAIDEIRPIWTHYSSKKRADEWLGVFDWIWKYMGYRK